MRKPRVWALLGPHRGDNNQVLALAEALGVPFEIKALQYNRWRHLQPRLLGASLWSVSRASRALVVGDPPDLTISTGHRSAPVVQFIRHRSGGRTRSVHIGFPRLPPERFDLLVATPEYPIPDRPNVMRIPLALSSGGPDPAKVEPSDAVPERFKSLAACSCLADRVFIGPCRRTTFRKLCRACSTARVLKARCSSSAVRGHRPTSFAPSSASLPRQLAAPCSCP